jgi:ribosomal-protein-alanine N-acetyltransferase
MRFRDFDAETRHVNPVVARDGFMVIRVTTWQDMALVDELRQVNRDWLAPWTLNNFNATGGARSFSVFWGAVPVGEIILWNLEKRTPQSSPTMSYWVDQTHARRGIMTYAVREVLRYAHTELDIDTVLVPVSEDNQASIGLARKVGLRELGPRSVPGASRHLLFSSEK